MAQTRGGIAYRLDDDGGKPPLALVMGFTGSSYSWTQRFLAALRAHYRLLLVDNRGTGESVKPKEAAAYDVAGMARDLDEVAAHAGLAEPFHVLGYSLGGCVALELALAAPARVRSLVIVASTAGGALYVPPADPTIIPRLVDPPGTFVTEKVLATWRILLSDAALRRHETELLENLGQQVTARALTPRFVFHGHMRAYQAFDRAADVGRIAAPMTVIHGADDRLTPLANSENLAKAAKAAELVVLPGVEHMPHVEALEPYVAAVRAATGVS